MQGKPLTIDLERLNPFTDVFASSDPAITKLYLLGVVSGKTATTFDPEGLITRQEAAVMLHRLCTVLGYAPSDPSTSTLNDHDQCADWAMNSIQTVCSAGIMSGVGNGTFNPRGLYSYEQSALTMVRMYQLLSNLSV